MSLKLLWAYLALVVIHNRWATSSRCGVIVSSLKKSTLPFALSNELYRSPREAFIYSSHSDNSLIELAIFVAPQNFVIW